MDKVLLFAAFVVGISGNLTLKHFSTSALLPALFSGAVIVTYAFWTFKSNSIRLEPEQIGDNSYYLGFILTLFSLAYTLSEISGHGMESEFIAEVISGFGVALSSTIFGVATRVFMQQFRLDLTARDHEARLAINKAMQDFRGELTNSIRGMKSFGTELRQSLEEHHEATAKAHEQRFEKSVEEVLAGFKSSMKEVVEESKRTNTIMTENSNKAIEDSKDGLIEALNKIEKSVELTGRVVSSATESIGKTVTSRLKENSDSLAEHANLTQQTNKQLKASITRFETTLKSVMERIENELVVTTSTTEKVSESLSSSASEMQMAIKSADQEIRRVSRQLNKQASEVMSTSQKLAHEESESATALKSAVESVESHIKQLNILIEQQNSKIHNMVEHQSESYRNIRSEDDIRFYSRNPEDKEHGRPMTPYTHNTSLKNTE
ncbi:hypothetical protein [Onishia taeanensis]